MVIGHVLRHDIIWVGVVIIITTVEYTPVLDFGVVVGAETQSCNPLTVVQSHKCGQRKCVRRFQCLPVFAPRPTP